VWFVSLDELPALAASSSRAKEMSRAMVSGVVQLAQVRASFFTSVDVAVDMS